MRFPMLARGEDFGGGFKVDVEELALSVLEPTEASWLNPETSGMGKLRFLGCKILLVGVRVVAFGKEFWASMELGEDFCFVAARRR